MGFLDRNKLQLYNHIGNINRLIIWVEKLLRGKLKTIIV